jgi:hypothetical protein
MVFFYNCLAERGDIFALFGNSFDIGYVYFLSWGEQHHGMKVDVHVPLKLLFTGEI